jgi:phosphatidylglycerol---prolipoprotein diacylglyceryl transferase
MLGRLANFVNGELLGKVVAMPGQPAPWWAVKFPQEVLVERWPGIPERTAEQEVQLRALVAQYAPTQPDVYSGYQHVLELLQRGNRAVAQQLEPLISARVPSQLLQAAAEGLGVGLTVWFVARKPRLPGILGCWFLISYGVLRIITEQFWRLPDAKFADPRPYGLSRGQWLSVLMVVIGLVALVWLVRRGGQKLGGWGVRHDAAPAGPN